MWPPDVIRGLTVWQMRNYRDAQARRVERMSKDGPNPDPGAATPPPDQPPPRGAMVASMIELGYTRESAEAAYDRQIAAWEASRGDPA